MAARKDVDSIVHYLVRQIAFTGASGASLGDFKGFLKDFYGVAERPSTQQNDATTAQDAIHDGDRPLQERAWQWVRQHPDVNITWLRDGLDLSEKSLSEVESLQESLPSQQDPETMDIRLKTSQRHFWLALAGHPPDTKRITGFEFDLLQIIAAHGPRGIVQPELVKLSGQDKRSAPPRTTRLAQNGYIEKTPYQTGGMRTSLLVSKRYASKGEDAGPESAAATQAAREVAARDEMIDFENMFNKLLDMISDGRVRWLEDIRRTLGIYGKRQYTRVFGRCIVKMADAGIITRVLARQAALYSHGESKWLRCIKMVRPITEKDRKSLHRFCGDAGAPGIEDEDAVAVEDLMDVEGEVEDSAVETQKKERSAPLWTPDVSLLNQIYQMIDAAGPEGISSMELNRRLAGDLYKRPMHEVLMSLTDHWELSQPKHLQHLSIIRDSALEGKTSFFKYRSFANFGKAVELGQAHWEAVSTVNSSPKAAKGKGKAAKQNTPAEVEVDEWGFPKIPDEAFASTERTASLAECERALRIPAHKKYRVGSSPPKKPPKRKNVDADGVPIKGRPRKYPKGEEPYKNKNSKKRKAETQSPTTAKRKKQKTEETTAAEVSPTDQTGGTKRGVVGDGLRDVAAAVDDQSLSLVSDVVATEAARDADSGHQNEVLEPQNLADTNGRPAKRRRGLPAPSPRPPRVRKPSQKARESGASLPDSEFVDTEAGPGLDADVEPSGLGAPPNGTNDTSVPSLVVKFSSSKLAPLGRLQTSTMTSSTHRSDITIENTRPNAAVDFPDSRQTTSSQTIPAEPPAMPKGKAVVTTESPRGFQSSIDEVRDHGADQQPSPLDAPFGSAGSLSAHRSTLKDEALTIPSKRRPRAKRDPKVKGGSLNFLRTQVALEIIDDCGGVFPGLNEITVPFHKRWSERGFEGNADRQTIRRALQRPIDAGQLKKLTFTFAGVGGTVFTRAVYVRPGIDFNSPAVRECQRKIREFHPHQYIPTEPQNGGRTYTIKEFAVDEEALVITDYKTQTMQMKEQRLTELADGNPNRRVTRKRIHRRADATPRYLHFALTETGRRDFEAGRPSRRMSSARKADKFQFIRDKLSLEDGDAITVDAGQEDEGRVGLCWEHSNPADYDPMYEYQLVNSLTAPQQHFHGPSGTFSTDTTYVVNARRSLWVQEGVSENFELAMPHCIDDMTSVMKKSRVIIQGGDSYLDQISEIFRQEIDAVQAWELTMGMDDSRLYGELVTPRFINHNFPAEQHERPLEQFKSVRWETVQFFTETGISKRGAGPILVTPATSASPSVIVSDTTDLTMSRSNSTISMEEVTFDSPPLNFANIDHFLAAITVVKTLAGGPEGDIRWNILRRIFPKCKDHVFRERWKKLRKDHTERVVEMCERFQEAFLVAYEKGELPFLDFKNFMKYDWKRVIHWMMENIIAPPTSFDGLPRDLSAFGRRFVFKPEVVPNRNELRFCKEGKLRSVQVKDAYSYSLDHPITSPLKISPKSNIPPTMESDPLGVACSWARATVTTPPSLHDPVTSRRLLELLGTNLVDSALAHLLSTKMVTHQYKGRTKPGRNYSLSPGPGKACVNASKIHAHPSQLRDAIAFKEELDAVFCDETGEGPEGKPIKFFRLAREASDGAILAITNLLASGRIRVVSIAPPTNHTPFAPGPRLSKWGLEDGTYRTIQLDRERLFWDLHILPTTTYIPSNPLLRHKNPTSLPSPPGKPRIRHADTNGGTKKHLEPIPIWYTLQGYLLADWWLRVLVAVLGCLEQRPGIPLAEMADEALKGMFWQWELALVVGWLVEVGAVAQDAEVLNKAAGVGAAATMAERGKQTEREGEGVKEEGYVVREWWWMAMDAARLAVMAMGEEDGESDGTVVFWDKRNPLI